MKKRIQTIVSIIFFTVVLVTSSFAKAELHTFKENLSDSLISTKITAKYTKDHDLNPLKITVSTHNGIVTITGHVKDKSSYVKALRLAKETKGVKKIEADNLSIKQVNTTFTDAYITAKIETAILKAKVFDDESIPLVGINAQTINGTVTLTGKVKSKQAIITIVKWANKVHGVKKIVSRLEVSASS